MFLPRFDFGELLRSCPTNYCDPSLVSAHFTPSYLISLSLCQIAGL